MRMVMCCYVVDMKQQTLRVIAIRGFQSGRLTEIRTYSGMESLEVKDLSNRPIVPVARRHRQRLKLAGAAFQYAPRVMADGSR